MPMPLRHAADALRFFADAATDAAAAPHADIFADFLRKH